MGFKNGGLLECLDFGGRDLGDGWGRGKRWATRVKGIGPGRNSGEVGGEIEDVGVDRLRGTARISGCPTLAIAVTYHDSSSEA